METEAVFLLHQHFCEWMEQHVPEHGPLVRGWVSKHLSTQSKPAMLTLPNDEGLLVLDFNSALQVVAYIDSSVISRRIYAAYSMPESSGTHLFSTILPAVSEPLTPLFIRRLIMARATLANYEFSDDINFIESWEIQCNIWRLPVYFTRQKNVHFSLEFLAGDSQVISKQLVPFGCLEKKQNDSPKYAVWA